MTTPTVTISEGALQAFHEAKRTVGEDEVVRLVIDAKFQNDLYFAPLKPNDVVLIIDGLTLAMDPRTARRADGLKIEYIEGPPATGFKLDNPNASSPLNGVCPADVVRMLESGKKFVLIDARSESERAKACVEAARPLDASLRAELESMSPKVKLVFMGHHSTDGRTVARTFHERGFKDVWYVVGGIDAWSTMDPAIPRY